MENFLNTAEKLDENTMPDEQNSAVHDLTDVAKAPTAQEENVIAGEATSISGLGDTGSMHGLDKAIEGGQGPVTSTPQNYPDRAGRLINFGVQFWDRFQQTRSLDDLNEAIKYTEEALRYIPQHHSDRANGLYNLAVQLGNRFYQTGSLDDINDAVKYSFEAVKSTPEEHPEYAERLHNLGIRLGARFNRTESLDDLNEAIKYIEEAVMSTPENHPDRAGKLSTLGNQLGDRFTRTGSLDDLNKAIQYSQEAVMSTPKDHPHRARRLNKLGMQLGKKFHRTGSLDVLDESIRCSQEAVTSAPKNHTDRTSWMTNLGNRLGDRFTRTGFLDDLNKAINYTYEAVMSTHETHQNRATMLNSLGLRLAHRFHRTGSLDDLNDAIKYTYEAVIITPKNHPKRVIWLTNLGNRLQDKFDRTGSMDELNEAIKYSQEAVMSTPKDHPERAGKLNNFAVLLAARFDYAGSLDDLNQAIEYTQEALTSTPEAHPERVKMLSNLGNKLGARFNRSGSLDDLDEAIKYIQEAVIHTPENHPDLAGTLNNLGIQLGNRYVRTSSPGDLNNAIKYIQEAILSVPEDHPDRAAYLSNLGVWIRSRFTQTRSPADLDEAIRCTKEALALTPDNHQNRAIILNSLGTEIWDKFNQTGSLDDLNEAIKYSQEAVVTTPENYPDRATRLNNLGIQLADRSDITGSLEDMRNAIQLSIDAVKCSGSPPANRIDAARFAVHLLLKQSDYHRAYNILETAIKLFPQLSPRSLNRQDQQYMLGNYTNLASRAASIAFEAGKSPHEVVELLEHGRGVMISLVIDSRSDVSRLREEHPKLHSKFQELRDEIDSPVSIHGDQLLQVDSAIHRTQVLTKRHTAVQEFEKTVQLIRQQKGFERFQLPPSASELMKLAGSGPIVLYNVTSHRCDAVIITSTSIDALPLPDLQYTELERYAEFMKNLRKIRLREFADACKKMSIQLQWLWDVAVEPVLNRLGFHRPAALDQQLPRIWWITCGLMSIMPIHAAGNHSKGSINNTLSRVISSYSPTIKALSYARERIIKPFLYPRSEFLIVTMPTTEGESTLQSVEKEANDVTGAIPSSVTIHRLNLPRKAEVVDKLQSCTVAHFACHGVSSDSNPSDSRLLLIDHKSDPLTVGDITNLRLSRAQLAFLSACQTADNPSQKLLDEVIHVTSGCQLAGFPHVIGSLWKTNDKFSPTIARGFYASLSADITSPRSTDNFSVAFALHKAVKSAKESARTQPLKWAPYIHMGA